MILIASREEKQLLERLRSLGKSAVDAGELTAEVIALKQQIASLKIEKSQKEEEYERRERELQHMIGLEKKRQEVEIQQSKRDAELSIREGNLAAERTRFEEQLKFNTSRFERMEKYLKHMMGDILERLPNISMTVEKKVRG